MIRSHTNPIIFLLDNCEYVIEEQIHPGSYNKLQDWDYCALAHAMKGKTDNLWAAKVWPEGCLPPFEPRLAPHPYHCNLLTAFQSSTSGKAAERKMFSD